MSDNFLVTLVSFCTIITYVFFGAGVASYEQSVITQKCGSYSHSLKVPHVLFWPVVLSLRVFDDSGIKCETWTNKNQKS